MTQSKGWGWNKSKTEYWKKPAEEFIPIAKRWKEKGFKEILDLGCGIGRHSIYLAQENINVTAVDLGIEGIETLRSKAQEFNLPINIEIKDMLKLDYPKESFDAVLAFHTIQHTDYKGLKKVIGDIYKILKRGGEAFVTFASKENDSWTKYEKDRIDDYTLIKTEGPEVNVPHTYVEYEDLLELTKQFKITDIKQIIKYLPKHKYAHFFVLLKKS
jgi:2-polyprenyl-3-methyl-5-hydroxy-6-metoxy-1,4-benzoquinol methylase